MGLLLIDEIIPLFLMMGLGYLIVKAGWLKAEDSRVLSVLSIDLIMPCVIIQSFQIEISGEIVNGFLLALLAAVLIHAVLVGLEIMTRKSETLSAVGRASIIYSNVGNLIVPLVSAILGTEWIVYASAFMCVQLFFIWTHGQSLISGIHSLNWKKIFLNINLISIGIGLILMMVHITLPELMMITISKIAGLIGPLGMIMIGVLLAGINLKKVFTQKRIYQITILKMVVVPLLVLGLLFVLSRFGIDEDQKMILWIVFSCGHYAFGCYGQPADSAS